MAKNRTERLEIPQTWAPCIDGHNNNEDSASTVHVHWLHPLISRKIWHMVSTQGSENLRIMVERLWALTCTWDTGNTFLRPDNHISLPHPPSWIAVFPSVKLLNPHECQICTRFQPNSLRILWAVPPFTSSWVSVSCSWCWKQGRLTVNARSQLDLQYYTDLSTLLQIVYELW